jgi:MFS family permease
MNRPRAREGLPQPQRRRAMLVVLTGLSMSVLDGAIANIALPTIAAELRTDPANAVLVVNAYQLALTVSLLPFASLGELRGYRRVFVWGLAVFTLGSLACALSGSLNALVASRILQGFGGAGLMSVNTALLRFIYPADQLGRGVGINALVGSASAAIGPSVAAGILSIASWQWLFAINVPLGVVALVLAWRELPRTSLARHRFDWLSALLSALTLGALIIGAGFAAAGAMASSLRLFGFRQAEPPPPCWPDGLKPVPGASLVGGFGSLLGRFISLFARLGNLPPIGIDTNDLRPQPHPKTRPKPRFTLFLPVEQGKPSPSVDRARAARSSCGLA